MSLTMDHLPGHWVTQHVLQWPECSSIPGQQWSEHFPTPNGNIWAREKVHGGNCICKECFNQHYPMTSTWWLKKLGKLSCKDQDHQRALAGAPVGAPSVWQLPRGSSLKIDLQTAEAWSIEFCLILLNHTYRYRPPPKIYTFKAEYWYHSSTVSRSSASNWCS